MAASDFIELYSDTTVSASVNGATKVLEGHWRDMVGWVEATNGSTPDIDIDLQQSGDGGTSWDTFASFTNITADGVEAINIAVNVMNRVRAAVTVNSGSADLVVKLWYDPQSK